MFFLLSSKTFIISLGFQTAYYYRTMFGPVGATLGWSDKTHRVNFFINLGYEFLRRHYHAFSRTMSGRDTVCVKP